MYGIVNRAIQEMISSQYGENTWARVKMRSGVTIDFFGSNDPYPDEVTYALAGAAAAELDLPLNEVLRAFGHHWVLHTSRKKYGGLLEAGGTQLRSFLMALPQFHTRILLLFPQLRPPEFVVYENGPQDVSVHYYSERQGLEPFVQGLLEGLGLLYQTPAVVQQVQSRAEGYDHTIFSVSW